MKYDTKHIDGCHRTYVETRLTDDHERGDHIRIRCRKCGQVGTHEIIAPLRGIA